MRRALSLLCLALAACNPDLPQFCSQMRAEIADKRASCVGYSVDYLTAIDAQEGFCAAYGRSVEAGRLQYEAGTASACLDLIKNLSCTEFAGFSYTMGDNPCAKTLSGQVGGGSPCYETIECAEGFFCVNRESQCPGVCKALKPVGADCAVDDACVKGAECDAAKCYAYLGAGQSCGDNPPYCGPGLICSSGVCAVPADKSPCYIPADCAGEHVCAGASLLTHGPGTCTPGKKLGQPCVQGRGECLFGLGCRNGVCSLAKLGDQCGLIGDNDNVACSEGWCDQGLSGEGTCAVYKNPGESCTGFGDCGRDALCGGTFLNPVCEKICTIP